MIDAALNDNCPTPRLAVFERDAAGRLVLIGHPSQWLATLWPRLAEDGGVLAPKTSAFLDRFLADAAPSSQAAELQRLCSAPWVEWDAAGRPHSLRAVAFSAGGRVAVLVEALGAPDEPQTAVARLSSDAALALAMLQRAEQSLSEQKELLQAGVLQLTNELARVIGALREEVAAGRRYAERLRGLREIERAIVNMRSPADIAEAALCRLDPLVPCEQACVVALEPESGRARVLARVLNGEILQTKGAALSSTQLADVPILQSGQLQRIRNQKNIFETTANSAAGADTVWPLIVDIPLLVEDTLVGVLNLATSQPASFSPEVQDIAEEVAGFLALALSHSRLFNEVIASREQLRALSLRLVEVQETERRFTAHELHDQIGQLLTGLKLTLELPGQESAQAPNQNVTDAIAMVDELIGRVRQLSLDLRPHILDDLGLLPALDWLFKRYRAQTGIVIHFKHTALQGRLPTQLETAAFRIVQEALTNIARHAKVKEATVRVWMDGKNLGVQVEDKGAGFDAVQALTAHSSSGVAGMRERALMLGGVFTLEAEPGKGARLTAELPLPANPPPDEAGKEHRP